MAVEPVSGQLLIAGPTLLDPNFQRTVVLMIEHGPEGALGLVLNRTSESTVGEAVSELEGLLEPDSPVFVGGPVQPSGLIVLARFLEPDAAALLSFGDVGILRAEASLGDPPDLLATRAFAGHAGWGPGQLDYEVERGDWILEPASVDDAFTEDPDGLWSDVLARKGGSYALVARMPLDPSVN
jgi:putative transcriptional regulator